MRTYTSPVVPSRSPIRLGHNQLKLNGNNGGTDKSQGNGPISFPNTCSGCGRVSNFLSPVSTTRKDKYVKTSSLERVCPMCAGNMAQAGRREMAMGR